MTDYRTRLFEGFSAYQEAVSELYTNARTAAADIEDRCSAELFAAGSGDDATARMGQAWLRYQQEMAKLSYETGRGLREQQREWATTVEDLLSDAETEAYESYMAAIESFGSTSAGMSTGESGDTKSAASDTRRARRRTRPESSD
jgi:hypothetical protein